MTQVPNPEREPESNGNNPERRRRRRRWLWASIAAIATLSGGLTVGWFVLKQQLAPRLTKILSNSIERPLNLGAAESLSLTSVRFGETEIPPTSTDPDWAKVEAVDVKFNLFKLLFDRTLELDITLIDPTVYIEEDADGEWIATRLDEPGEESPLTVDVQTIRAENASIDVVKRAENGTLKEPVELQVPRAVVRTFNDYELLEGEAKGTFEGGGKFDVNASVRPDTWDAKVSLATQDLNLPYLSRLVNIPVIVQSGTVGTNLEITLAGNPRETLPELQGVATLQNISAKLNQEAIKIQAEPDNTEIGKRSPFFFLNDLPVKLPPISKTNGRLRFQGKKVRIEDFITKLDRIDAAVGGVIDLESGYNLNATTESTTIKELLQTFDLKAPGVPLSGGFKVGLKVTGPLDKPLVAGNLIGTQPFDVDKVRFRDIQAKFAFSSATSIFALQDFQATPTGGGKVRGKGQIKLGKEGKPGTVALDFRTENVPGDAIASLYFKDELPFRIGPVNLQTQVFGPLNKIEDLQARVSTNKLLGSGNLTVNNIKLKDGRWRGNLFASNLPLNRVLPATSPLRSEVGTASARLDVSGRVNNFSLNTLTAQGNVSAGVAGGTVRANNLQLNNGRFTTQLQASDVQTASIAAKVLPPDLSLPALGALNGNLNLAGRLGGNTAGLPVQELQGDGSLAVAVAGGTVAARGIQVTGERWQADVAANNVQLNRFTAGRRLPPALAQAQQALGALSGNFNVSGSLNEISPKTLTARGTSRISVAGGTVNALVNLNRGNWQADIAAAGIQPQRLSRQIPPALQSPVSGNFNLRGTLDNLSPEAIVANGSGRINLAGGTVTARNLRLANGNLRATLNPSNIQLDRVSSLLDGRLGGSIDVTTNLANLTPEGIRATGEVNFSEGISLIDRPLTAAFNWNGNRLRIDRATATGLSASGYIDPNLTALRRGQIGLDLIKQVNLDVNAQNLNLPRLFEQGKDLITLPTNIATVVNQTDVAGRADFDGNIRGTLRAPQIQGTLALRNVVINDLALDPIVSGPVAFVPGEGGSLRLVGTDDKVALDLGADYKPNSFLLEIGEFAATGVRQGDIFAINARQFPLALAKKIAPSSLLPTRLASQPLSGQLSGNFNVNLNTLAASGTITVENPLLSRISGDRFTTSFQYANGAVAIEDAKFVQGETQYLLSGRIIPQGKDVLFDAELSIEEGQIQDILTTIQIFDITDFARLLQLPNYSNSGDLQTVGLNVANLPLITQLRRFSEIEALLEEQRRRRLEVSPLPPLAEAQGSVTGKIDISGSLSQGLDIDFDFAGDDWQWGTLEAERAIAQGTFQEGVLSIRPFKLELEDGGEVSFSGSIGGDTQSGQLQVVKLPIFLLQEFVPLPPDIGFTGFINANAVLGGSQENPQARGSLTVVDATLNTEKIESTQGSFSYNNARLNFSVDSVITADTEPLQIAGSFPYKAPLKKAMPPDSDAFQLALNLKDNGLSVLNILTRQQLIWEEGSGNVDLEIGGRYDQKNNELLDLQAQGLVNLQDAEISSLFLEDTLNDIDGVIRFDFDRLTVDSLTGTFGGGDITVVGSLPLTQPIPQENPLTATLNGLTVNLKGLYSGDVGGNIQLTGAALQPDIGGEVKLSDGRVLLAGLVIRRRFISNAESGEGNANTGSALGGILNRTEFNNLALSLGDDLRLEQPFLLNFGARGTISVNGSISEIKPSGIVELVNGQINLFTTQLRLRGGYDNVAIFQPEFGLNPRLDLRLVGTAVETTRTLSPTNPISSEISESLVNFGSVETIRVEAIVNGFALDLLKSLRVEPGTSSAQLVRSVIELTSSPPRSETQIIALLGGSFINAFSQEDSGLGLANLAGTALFGTLQNALANALGLSEFRIFPSAVTDPDSQTSTVGLAAELGYNITDDLGVSVTQFLTPQVPTQVNVRYRLNDYFLLRGSTNFSNDNRFQVEYRQRF
ncbi:translocation/assembly module TamB domain-containing protein [Lusitaniella coriacea LEGE 07157]|uniref:Translocation/assembly module TamB domain-containing protein n=1 Tax=Lusitaniella coriacea LEGE 07157 TaxID=945747 RepID=A0A8J7J2P5_9CYAN|nr:translocation/assembly module TamB [Lusitaniella coriacea]MBE9116479.1 translocation/assembly module TamB domain-containing protein [Lusitaniella coriacea LEGE 07157]